MAGSWMLFLNTPSPVPNSLSSRKALTDSTLSSKMRPESNTVGVSSMLKPVVMVSADSVAPVLAPPVVLTLPAVTLFK